MKLDSHSIDCLAEPVRNDVIEFLLEEMKEFEGGPRVTILFVTCFSWLHTGVF